MRAAILFTIVVLSTSLFEGGEAFNPLKYLWRWKQQQLKELKERHMVCPRHWKSVSTEKETTTCVRFFKDHLTFSAAASSCRDKGAQLAMVNDAHFNRVIYNLHRGAKAWIGLSDSQHEGHFKWTNGDRVTFKGWGGGEPNNAGNEDCVYQWSNYPSWNDADCGTKVGYLCQKSGCPRHWKSVSTEKGTTTCVRFFKDHLTYSAAASSCRDKGAQLAMVNDAHFNGVIFNLHKGAIAWIGLSDRQHEGHFKWTNGGRVTFKDWASGEPNDYKRNEDCGHQKSRHPSWNDRDCADKAGYLCQKSELGLGSKHIQKTDLHAMQKKLGLGPADFLAMKNKLGLGPADLLAMKNSLGPSDLLALKKSLGPSDLLALKKMKHEKPLSALEQAEIIMAKDHPSVLDKEEVNPMMPVAKDPHHVLDKGFPCPEAGVYIYRFRRPTRVEKHHALNSCRSHGLHLPKHATDLCADSYRSEKYAAGGSLWFNEDKAGGKRLYMCVSGTVDVHQILNSETDAEDVPDVNDPHHLLVNTFHIQHGVGHVRGYPCFEASIYVYRFKVPTKRTLPQAYKSCRSLGLQLPQGNAKKCVWAHGSVTAAAPFWLTDDSEGGSRHYVCASHKVKITLNEKPVGCHRHWSAVKDERGTVICVKWFTKAMTFPAGRQHCSNLGTQMVMITDKTLNRAVFRLHRGSTSWIGLSDKDNEGVWKWTNGQTAKFTGWAENQPDNWKKSEHCASQSPRTTRWNDAQCSIHASYICQTSPRPLDPREQYLADTTKVSCPKHWTPAPTALGSVTCLKLSMDRAAFSAAQRACVAMGSQLVKVEDPVVNVAVLELHRNIKSWIGLSDNGHEGEWRWTDGELASFQTWRHGTPDNQDENKHCAYQSRVKAPWIPTGCSTRLPFTCQRNADLDAQPVYDPANALQDSKTGGFPCPEAIVNIYRFHKPTSVPLHLADSLCHGHGLQLPRRDAESCVKKYGSLTSKGPFWILGDSPGINKFVLCSTRPTRPRTELACRKLQCEDVCVQFRTDDAGCLTCECAE